MAGCLWDIACPTQPSRVPGVTMAGFGDRGITPPGLRLIPHPAVTLILVFGGTIAVEDAAGRQHQGSFVTGLGFGEALRVLRAENFGCLQVRLSPVAAHAVLGAAVAGLDGAVVTLDDLQGREAARISEHLGDLSLLGGSLRVDRRVARPPRCAAASQVAPEVAWAWRSIVTSHGMVRIEDLAAELGWSRKRLWSRFHSQIGLPPKRAAKLSCRFDHAVHGLVAGQDAAGVAADGGYTDQSHLHRDVVAFTGLTPATVVIEPFLAVDDIAWGWPGPRNSRGRPLPLLVLAGDRAGDDRGDQARVRPVPEAAVLRRAAPALRRGNRRHHRPAPGDFAQTFTHLSLIEAVSILIAMETGKGSAPGGTMIEATPRRAARRAAEPAHTERVITMVTDRDIRAAVYEKLVTDPLIDADDIVVEVFRWRCITHRHGAEPGPAFGCGSRRRGRSMA